MTEHRLHNTVYARLDAVLNAEKITRVELGHLSRELLEYVVDTHDIGIVNRLIAGLTPVNRKVAILYFTHFLPWQVEKQDDVFSRFGKMKDKSKQVKRHLDAVKEWLAEETNNIWVWADANIEVEQRKVDLSAGLDKALDQAINGVETDKTIGEPLSKVDIMATVMKHITPEEMLEALSSLEDEMKKAEAEVMGEQAAA